MPELLQLLARHPRVATKVVAASDSDPWWRQQADYVCNGTNDEETIQEAIDDVAAVGGVVQLSEGNFSTAASIVLRNGDYIWLRGQGPGTQITLADNSNVDMITMDNVSRVGYRLSDFQMNGNSANQASGNGIVLGGRFTEIWGVWVTLIQETGIQFIPRGATSISPLVHDCFITQCGTDGLENQLADGQFRDILIDSITRYGVWERGGNSSYVGVTAAAAKGFYMNAREYQLTGCSTNGTDEEAIFILNAEIGQITGCIFRDASTSVNNGFPVIGVQADGGSASHNTIVNGCVSNNDVANRPSRFINAVGPGTLDTWVITGNRVAGLRTAPAVSGLTSPRIDDNSWWIDAAYLSNSRGTAQITAGNTSVDVTHNLDTTPTYINVTPQEAEGVDFFVNTVGATTFRINIPAAQGVNVNFYWEARTT